MKLTALQEGHILQMADIERLCFSDPWSEASLTSELKNENAFYIVATEGETVLGYVGCHMILDEGYITNVAVHPSHRSHGLGHQLICALGSLAYEKELAFLSLEVRESNAIAIALYAKNGFMPVGLRKNYYEKPKENGLIMTHTL